MIFPEVVDHMCPYNSFWTRWDAYNLHNQLCVLIRGAAIFNILEKWCQANTRILKASASLISRQGAYLPFLFRVLMCQSILLHQRVVTFWSRKVKNKMPQLVMHRSCAYALKSKQDIILIPHPPKNKIIYRPYEATEYSHKETIHIWMFLVKLFTGIIQKQHSQISVIMSRWHKKWRSYHFFCSGHLYIAYFDKTSNINFFVRKF